MTPEALIIHIRISAIISRNGNDKNVWVIERMLEYELHCYLLLLLIVIGFSIVGNMACCTLYI